MSHLRTFVLEDSDGEDEPRRYASVVREEEFEDDEWPEPNQFQDAEADTAIVPWDPREAPYFFPIQ